MQPKSLKLLADIADAAAFVLECVRDKSVEDYCGDRLLRQAVERNFEIIGEAVNRLAKLDPVTAERISDASHIVAFRNVLIHGYDLIDHAQVWAVIDGSLPILHDEVQAIIASG